MSVEVRFATLAIENHFKKTLKRIQSRDQISVIEAIENFGINPRPYGALKIVPPVTFFSMKAYYRIRVGDFRILYNVDDEKKLVFAICLMRRNEKTYK